MDFNPENFFFREVCIMSKKKNKKTNSEKKGNESITFSTLNSVETVAERDEPVILRNTVDFEQGNLGKGPLNSTISEKTIEERSFGQISPLGVTVSDEQCSAPNVKERTSVNYPYEKDNTCSSREIKSAIVSKDLDEIKARNYKTIIKRALLLKKKGKDPEEILTELLKKLSIPPEEGMDDDVVPMNWCDSEDDNSNMDGMRGHTRNWRSWVEKKKTLLLRSGLRKKKTFLLGPGLRKKKTLLLNRKFLHRQH